MVTREPLPEAIRRLADDEAFSRFMFDRLRLALTVGEEIDRERATELLNYWPELLAEWRELEDVAKALARVLASASSRVEAALEQDAK